MICIQWINTFWHTPMSTMQNSILSVKFVCSLSWQVALNAGLRMYFSHSVFAVASFMPPAVGQSGAWEPQQVYNRVNNGADERRKSWDISKAVNFKVKLFSRGFNKRIKIQLITNYSMAFPRSKKINNIMCIFQRIFAK